MCERPLKTPGGQGRFVVFWVAGRRPWSWRVWNSTYVTTVQVVGRRVEGYGEELPRAGPIWRTVATGCLRERQVLSGKTRAYSYAGVLLGWKYPGKAGLPWSLVTRLGSLVWFQETLISVRLFVCFAQERYVCFFLFKYSIYVLVLDVKP